LNLLPKEYFGSFDLVLVELSETVLSFSVVDKDGDGDGGSGKNEQMDVLQALSLLLNENGILLKNELYFGVMRELLNIHCNIHIPVFQFCVPRRW